MTDPLRVLLVDDEPDHRLVLSRGLVEADPALEVVESEGLTSALAWLGGNRADVVLSDHQLGDGDGLELLRRLRASEQDVPVIVVTSHGSEALARRAFLEGAADYLTKDRALRDPGYLVRKLRAAAEKSRLVRERERAEALFHEFLDNNPFATVIFSADGRIARYNRAARQLETKPGNLEQLVDRFNAFEDPQFRKTGLTDLWKKALEGQWVQVPPFPWSPEPLGVAGPTRILSGVVFPLAVGGDAEPHVCAMFQDVTRQETAHRERDEYAAILASLLNASRSAIVFVDNKNTVRFANRWVERFFGVDPSRHVGRPRDGLVRAIAAATADPSGFEARVRHLYDHPEVEADDGIEVVRPVSRHLRRHSGPVRGPGGAILGRIERYVDETEAVRRQHRLADRNQDLDVFAARLAHDLKTPLVSLRGFADLLERQSGARLDDQARLYLDKVRTSAALLSEMVDGLRELAQAGDQPADMVSIEPLPVLRLVRDTLAPDAREQDVAVYLPEAAPPVRCERAKLFQVFQNLLANAIRYADPAKPERWVRIEVLEDEDGVRFQVEDNGVGMVPEDLEEAFLPFRRGRNARGTSGMGLGLAIVERLVQSCGGRIRVHAEPAAGSRFTVTLPAG